MESILQACEDLGDLSMEDCQLVLDNPQDPIADTLPMQMSKEAMESLLNKMKNIGDDIPRDGLVLNALKRLSAYAISNVLNGADHEGEVRMPTQQIRNGRLWTSCLLLPSCLNTAKLLAARIVVMISSLPSASAFGVLNSNVVHALLNTVNKIIGGELKTLQKGSKAPKAAISMDIQLDSEEPESSQRSTGSRSSQRLSQTMEESESEEEAEAERDPFEARGASRTQAAAALAAKDKLKPQQLSAFVGLLALRITIFSTQSDEYILNASADLLVSIMYLCSIRSEFSGKLVL